MSVRECVVVMVRECVVVMVFLSGVVWSKSRVCPGLARREW
jgi:hypothetical protein